MVIGFVRHGTRTVVEGAAKRNSAHRSDGLQQRMAGERYTLRSPRAGMEGHAMQRRFAGLLGVAALVELAVGIFGSLFDGQTAEAVKPGVTVTVITAKGRRAVRA